MVDLIDLTKTVDAIRSASALTEITFLQVGQTLEASIGILSSLTSSFGTVLTELKGEKLTASLETLAGAAARVAGLGRREQGASAQFDRLQRVAEAITARISKMNRSVKAVDSLVINSKIAAAAIRASEIDFTTFADEIAGTMEMTRTTLSNFGTELETLRKRVGSAYAVQIAFDKRQAEATCSIPARLNATVNSIPMRHKRAAQAISAVRQRSELVRQQICSAITALQAGDIARQRLEHADQALGSLTQTQAHPATSGHAAFAEDEQRALIVVTCRLQSAQLSDAFEEFERDVRRITTSLKNLAAEARTLRTLAASAYGSAGHDPGTFIVDLEAQVGEALALFADFGTSQAEVTSVMASVSESAESLCGHLRTVQSFEDDIRIMGLNTTLKCSRVGPEGRALGLIAQELRGHGNEFAKEAGALMGDVRNFAEITSLIGAMEADSALLIASVMQAMQDALSTLQQVGYTLGDTLSELERDSDRVVLLLDETARNLGGHDEIGNALRQAVTNLWEISPSDDLPLANLTSHGEQVLERMARSYTMANERNIHNRILGRSSGGASAQAMVARAELEDMLF